MDVSIEKMRETRQGDVLVIFGKEPKNKDIFEEALRRAVGDRGSVRGLTPRSQIEIRDLDSTVEPEEVREAIVASLGDQVAGDIKVDLTKTSFRGNVKAFVELNDAAAAFLVREERIKVGWVNCRVKQGDEALRCYRCHGYGHLAAGCKAEDRGKLCWRCGKEGHKAFESEAPHIATFVRKSRWMAREPTIFRDQDGAQHTTPLRRIAKIRTDGDN